jgi:hypothetical protein
MREPHEFELSALTIEQATQEFERQAGIRSRFAATTPVQVLFYNAASKDFALAWVMADRANRWTFPVQQEGPRFVYYLLKRLQDQNLQAGAVIFATAGAGALFYATPDTADMNTSGVVGLLPQNTPPGDFGNTVSSFAPGAQLTLLSNATAASQVYQGQSYRGTELLGLLATYLSGSVRASDEAITCKPDGTANTTGNIWEGNPSTGEATITSHAPRGGQTQPIFPSALKPSTRL